MTGSRLPRRVLAGRVVLAALLIAAAATPLARVVGGSQALRLMLLGVAPAAAIGLVVGLVTRRPGPAGCVGAAGGFALSLLLLGGEVDLIAGALVGGWTRILSVPLPVAALPDLVAAPVQLLTVATGAALGLALSRRPAAALVPAVVVLATMVMMGVGGPGSLLLLTAPAVVAALLLLAAAPGDTDGPFGGGAVEPGAGVHPVRALAGAAALVAITAAAVLAVPALPVGATVDPRAAVTPPLDLATVGDPLAEVSGRLANPGAPVLTARLSGALASRPRNWALLALEDFDGARWGSLVDARTLAALSGQAAGAVADVGVAEVALAPGAGPLLPHPPAVRTSTGAGRLRYDAEAELLAAGAPTGTFTVTAQAADPSPMALARATVPTDAEARRLTLLPACTPPELTRLARDATEGIAVPAEQLVALEQALQAAPSVYDIAADPGHGCARLTRFLQERRGTSQQFATAFALGARSLGLPARIVVGYLPGTAGADGRVLVTAGDAWVWPQVRLEGVGWVDLDPTPDPTAQAPRPRERPQGLAAVRAAVSAGEVTLPVPPGPLAVQPEFRDGSLPLPLPLAAVTLLLIVLLSTPAGLRARRRRAGRGGSPEAQVVAAWDEALRTLAAHGLPVGGRTASAIAAAVAPALRPPTVELARLMTRVLYAGQAMVPAEGVAAWKASDGLRRDVQRAQPWPRRLRDAVAPGQPSVVPLARQPGGAVPARAPRTHRGSA